MTTDSTVFRTFIPTRLEEALQEGLRHAMALGAEGAEAFVSVSRSRKAKVRNGVLDDLTASKRGGLGVRVLRRDAQGLKCGLATTTDLSRPDFRDLFGTAYELAALGDGDPWIRQAEASGNDDLPGRFRQEVENLSPEFRIQQALALETEARKASAKVSAVRESAWTDGSGVSLLLTQTGVRAFDLASSCSAAIELAVEQDGDRQAAWHWDAAREPGALDLAGIGRRAALKGERKLRPASLPAGKYRVVLDPEVTVDLLGIIASMLSAESVLKGRSLFKGRLGEAIASPLLTLIDDGRLPDGLASEPWDAEGLPTRRNILIEDGVLKTYLHTLKTAAEMGVAPTGTAGRGLGSNPGVTTFNLFPKAGDRSVAQLLADAGDGVLITEIMGLHTVDPVSGDLSVGASGVRIRGGELAESVDKLTLAGNLKELLNRIVAVGDDLTWFGSSAGLSLLLEDLALGGA
ncbi:MAG: TldD/PmbA family protein [Holophagaceae bacterium]|nr:TldD/PmbA family protein [Holophagaceae bacterium]